jgi:dienelactone hydrolase
MPPLLKRGVEKVRIEPQGLDGLLGVPVGATRVVIFAHGSGSGRFRPRNNYAAGAFRRAGLATFVPNLLTADEERNQGIFDIDLLASRLTLATEWIANNRDTAEMALGYFGASTGAAAALSAASRPDSRVAAIVCRGGRPDLALDALPMVRAPTLLLVGSLDGPVIRMNMRAHDELKCEKGLLIIDGASDLFEEPGKLDEAIAYATDWFELYL